MNDHISQNVQEVRERIAEAAGRSGRRASDITLVAVSKYASLTDGVIEAFLASGCTDLGESRPQLLQEKAQHFMALSPRWHLIGTLQRNKIRKILPYVALIHSIDSVRLAEAVDRIAEEEQSTMPPRNKPVEVLLEVAVSDDATKHGLDPDEISSALEKLSQRKHVAVKGLMCMAGLAAGERETRRQFAALRQLAESLKQKGLPENVSMTELSMGMSDDFEIAVEEGATLVRVGSKLYAP